MTCLILLLTSFAVKPAIAQLPDPFNIEYRTKASGNFSNPLIWEMYWGSAWVAALLPPTILNDVTVRHDVVQDVDFIVGTGKILLVTAGSYTVQAGKTFISLGYSDFGNFPLTIKSGANGTARIGSSTGIFATNMTVERFIPAKAVRKFTFLSSPVTQSVKNAWQQQIFVTGAGSGGTPCGAGASALNSNGFDDTQNDPASVFTYTEGTGASSNWIPITSPASVNLAPGVGFRVNVRGNRNVPNACQEQINYYGVPPAPDSVTLRSTGTYSTYIARPLSTGYTLLGNPYPCELSFAAFRLSNASKISNNIWMYAGVQANLTDAYSVWNSGQLAGFTGLALEYLIGSTDLIIPSGGAFFVETNQGYAGLNVNFFEAHKSNLIASGNTLFSRTESSSWADYTRIHLRKITDTVDIDNIIIRFSNDVSVSNTSYSGLDSYSFNSSGSSVSSLKGNSRLSIQTRNINFINDTVRLTLGSAAGDYKLLFNEYENFVKAQQILLIDKYMGSITDMKLLPDGYPFTITADALSQGNSRFVVVFKTAVTLPVKFVSTNAVRRGNNAEIVFSTTNEINLRDFTVESSFNGTDFKPIGNPLAASNAGTYTFTDLNVYKGVIYYRIKATDNDGKITYSNVARVEKITSGLQYTLYPNPVVNELHINVAQPAGSNNYVLKIIAANGSVTYQKEGNLREGVINVAMQKMPQGFYVAQLLLDNGMVYTDKFIKK